MVSEFELNQGLHSTVHTSCLVCWTGRQASLVFLKETINQHVMNTMNGNVLFENIMIVFDSSCCYPRKNSITLVVWRASDFMACDVYGHCKGHTVIQNTICNIGDEDNNTFY